MICAISKKETCILLCLIYSQWRRECVKGPDNYKLIHICEKKCAFIVFTFFSNSKITLQKRNMGMICEILQVTKEQSFTLFSFKNKVEDSLSAIMDLLIIRKRIRRLFKIFIQHKEKTQEMIISTIFLKEPASVQKLKGRILWVDQYKNNK